MVSILPKVENGHECRLTEKKFIWTPLENHEAVITYSYGMV